MIKYNKDINNWCDHTCYLQENCVFFWLPPTQQILSFQKIKNIINILNNITFFITLVPVGKITLYIKYINNHYINMEKSLNHKEYYHLLQSTYYKRPKNIIGITGTSGKTSILNFLYDLYDFDTKSVLIMGSNGLRCNVDNNNFSPLYSRVPISNLQYLKYLHFSNVNNIDNVILECTSIGIQQGRCKGIKFNSIVFLSITTDHIANHNNSFLEYIRAKFSLVNQCLQNIFFLKSNPYISYLKKFQLIKKPMLNIYYIDFNNKDNLNTIVINNNIIKIKNLKLILSSIYNKFNIYNLGISLSICNYLYGLNPSIQEDIFKIVKGRVNIINKNNGVIISDYAHNREKIQFLLNNVKKYYGNRKIISIFGVANNAVSSRFVGWKLCCVYSYKIILTNENYHTLDDKKNMDNNHKFLIDSFSTKITFIAERQNAIDYSIKNYCNKNYIILIIGHGNDAHIVKGNDRILFKELDYIKSLLTHR